ncbi:MAG: hypothetical protein KBA71_00900 [Opitutaceae bacterium]|nr:hypothetical protein [Opitutaceae bacterium]
MPIPRSLPDARSAIVFFLSLCGTVIALQAAGASAEIEISDTDYEGLPHFRIVTPGGTWYYDKSGGGFSRLIDRDGRDWIAFHMTPSRGPGAAAGAYRGIPNAVFGKGNPDAGVGHPGKDRCISTREAADVIRTVSKSGTWAWTWRFTPTHAIFRMEKADPDHPWWFLYEGPPAGRYAPREQYWGTSEGGPRRDTPTTGGVTGQWNWAYFGDNLSPRVLVLAQAKADSLGDSFRYLGTDEAGIDAPDGMAVFGFGRAPRPLLRGAGHEFRVGFMEMPVPDAAAHERLTREVEVMLQP